MNLSDRAALRRVIDHPATATEMTASLMRAIERDPNPHGRWKRAILSEEGAQLLVDIADPTGPNGARTFVLTVREV
jgi:hypothetical protein